MSRSGRNSREAGGAWIFWRIRASVVVGAIVTFWSSDSSRDRSLNISEVDPSMTSSPSCSTCSLTRSPRRNDPFKLPRSRNR